MSEVVLLVLRAATSREQYVFPQGSSCGDSGPSDRGQRSKGKGTPSPVTVTMPAKYFLETEIRG